MVRGAPVYDLYPPSDYRTTALGRRSAEDPNDADGDGGVGWLALRVRITNVRAGDEPAFLPPTAFMLADGEGNALPNALILTPPNPDASGTYYPGASREGWVVLELRAGSDATLVRFLPYREDPDPRYLTYGG